MFVTQLSHKHDLSVLSYFLILTLSITCKITWEKVKIYQEIQDGRPHFRQCHQPDSVSRDP